VVDWLMPKSVEDLTKRSSAFRRDLQKHLDAKFEEGRAKGRNDPGGDSGGEGRAPGGRMTLAQIDAMPMNEWMSKPKEERDRLLEEARK
jgi:hypothetical protein